MRCSPSSQWTFWDGLSLLLMGRRTLAVFFWAFRAFKNFAFCMQSIAQRCDHQTMACCDVHTWFCHPHLAVKPAWFLIVPFCLPQPHTLDTSRTHSGMCHHPRAEVLVCPDKRKHQTQHCLQSLDTQVEEVVEVLGCYFPIIYTAPQNMPGSVTRQELAAAVEQAMAATPALAPHVVPLFLEKLSSSLR